jgi:hypothetical protein
MGGVCLCGDCDGMCGLQRKRERGRQRAFGVVGDGWGRLPAVYTHRLPACRLMTVAFPMPLPLRLHGLGLEWPHVVQELEVT